MWGWQEFERFAVDVLSRCYAASGITIEPTAFQHDGGRDGEGIYIFQSGYTENGDDLNLVLRIWVEVKHTGRGSINMNRVGGHVILASNQQVNKLVLVTNTRFAERVIREMRTFCFNNRLSCAFVDGRRLLRLTTLPLNSTAHLPATAVTTPVRAPGSALAPGAVRRRPAVSLRLSADLFTTDAELNAAVVKLEPGEPLFIIADYDAGDPPLRTGEHCGILSSPPYAGRLSIYSTTCLPPLLANERCRTVYVAYPEPGASLDACDFKVGVRGGRRKVTLDCTGSALVGEQVLFPTDLTSQRLRTAAVCDQVDQWLQHGGIGLVGIRGAAGTGKSHLIQRLRRRWLTAGPLEITVRGGVFRDASGIFRRVTRAALSLPSFEPADAAGALVRQLLVKGGLHERAADRMAGLLLAIWEGGTSGTVPQDLAETLMAVLSFASTHRPVVLVVEDLHELQPSGLQLLLGALQLLRHGSRGRVLFVATSRPLIESGGLSAHEPLSDPLQSVFEFLGSGLVDLPAPGAADARALLRATVDGLDAPLADLIIGQVGSTPFALKEAVIFLEQKGWIQRVRPGEGAVFAIENLDAFRRRISTQALTGATRNRLALLITKLQVGYPALDNFLGAGAVWGRTFPLKAAAMASGGDEGFLDVQLERELFRWEILRTAWEEGEVVGEFAHDLIRTALLDRVDTPQLERLSRGLLHAEGGRLPPVSRARLAYCAGDATACERMAGEAAERATEEGQHWDALQARLLELAVVDPDRFGDLAGSEDLFGLVAIDEGMRHLPRTLAASYRPDRMHRAFALILECMARLARIGVGRQHGFEPLFTEGTMLARHLGDELGRARLEYFQGFSDLERDDFTSAARHHEEAEARYARANEDGPERLENLFRLFLCARQSGDLSRANEILDYVERTRGSRLTPAESARLLDYRGYALLYVDPPSAMPFWRDAHRISLGAAGRDTPVKYLISCGYLALLLDDLPQAEADLERCEAELATVSREVLRVRLHLNRGLLHLLHGRLADARLSLEEGARLGVKYGTFRRLWRVDANLSTLFEALGEPDRVLSYDRRSLQGVRVRAEQERGFGAKAPWLAQRHVLPAINVALRAREGSLEHEELLSILPAEARVEVERLACAAADRGHDPLPGKLEYHFKQVRTRLRALVTE
jgi:tetratricopeptide (TPR) repeat protein